MNPFLPTIIDATANLTGLPPELWRRIVLQGENSAEGWQTSPKGAFGPAQLMPATAAETNQNWFGGKLDPQTRLGNLMIGAAYASDQWNKYKDPVLTAVAYNAGPGRADKLKQTGDYGGLPKETRGYIRKVAGGDKQMADKTIPIPPPLFGTWSGQLPPPLFGEWSGSTPMQIWNKPEDRPKPLADKKVLSEAKNKFWRGFDQTGPAALWHDATNIWEYLKQLGNVYSGWAQSADQATTIGGYHPSDYLNKNWQIAKDVGDLTLWPVRASGLMDWFYPKPPEPAGPGLGPVQSNGMFSSMTEPMQASVAPNGVGDFITNAISAASGMVPQVPNIQAQQVPNPTGLPTPDYSSVFNYIDQAQQARGSVPAPQMDAQIPLWDKVLATLGTSLAGSDGTIANTGRAMLQLANLNQLERQIAGQNSEAQYKADIANREAAASFPMAKAKVAGAQAEAPIEAAKWLGEAQARANYYNSSFQQQADTQNQANARGRQDDIYNLANLIGNVNLGMAKVSGAANNPLMKTKLRLGGQEVEFGDIMHKSQMMGQPNYPEAALIVDSYRNGSIADADNRKRLDQYDRAYNQIAGIILANPTGTSAIEPLAKFLQQYGLAKDSTSATAKAVELVQQYSPGVSLTDGASQIKLKQQMVDNMMMQQLTQDLAGGQ